MRKILIFIVCVLVFVSALSINTFAVSGVPSVLPASTWSSVDPSRIEFRVDQSFPAVSVSSFSNTIESHTMPWLTKAEYSSAVGNTCAHLVTSFETDYSGGSVQAKVVSVKIPFGFRYQLSGALYFAGEFISANFTDSSGNAVTFALPTARVYYLDEAGNEKSRVLNRIAGDNSVTSFEYYIKDFVATITGIEFQFNYTNASAVVDNTITAYFNMYLSQIYVEHAKDVDPVLIPPKIEIPPDIQQIEDDYQHAIDDLSSDVDLNTPDILSILGSLVTDFHSVEMTLALSWWGQLFSRLFTVGVVKTIFYVFAMVSVSSVILGLTLPSWILGNETASRSASDSDSKSNTVSVITTTDEKGRSSTKTVVTKSYSTASSNNSSRNSSRRRRG